MASHTAVVSTHLCHSNHLFYAPLCEDLPTLRKVVNVFFHILTLGIPLAIYSITIYFFPKLSGRTTTPNIVTLAVDSVRKNDPCKEAMTFAMRKLAGCPEMKPYEFPIRFWSGKIYLPVNGDIAKLTQLYQAILLPNFEKAQLQYPVNPWTKKAVLEAADECMKVAYTIGILTLEDLKPFTENLPEGRSKNFADVITRQDSYQGFTTYYPCATIYHWARGAGTVDPNGHLQYVRGDISKKHAKLFYEKGTVQNMWNILYNDYCDKIRQYVNEEELHKADSRYVKWTQKDTGTERFVRDPS